MDGSGSPIAALHGALAIVVAAIALALVVVGALDAVGRVRARRLLDRLLLALIVVVLAAILLGPLVVVTVGGPDDPLHFVYAALALAVAPAARAEAARRGSARTGAWVATGGLVTLGALLRLWATGA